MSVPGGDTWAPSPRARSASLAPDPRTTSSKENRVRAGTHARGAGVRRGLGHADTQTPPLAPAPLGHSPGMKASPWGEDAAPSLLSGPRLPLAGELGPRDPACRSLASGPSDAPRPRSL